MDHPGELEIRGREFLWRYLSQSEPPLGRSDRHRAEFGARRHSRAARQRISGRATRLGQLPSGHGIHSVWMPPNPPYVETFQDNKIVADYFRHCWRERTRRLGDKARLLPFTGTIFPNTSYHGRQPRALCVWHPVSATQTEIWRFFLVDRDAPSEVKDLLRRYYMRYAGPAGMTEQDDMENWNYAAAA